MNEVAKCRRDHNRLGFAYQIGFARLFNRFPAQQPLEINDELLSFVAVQMNIDSERISDYASWQHTVSEHQARIQQYLGLRPFDLDENNALERFAFEESCRLEQTALLLARAQEFLHGPVFLVRRKRMSHTGRVIWQTRNWPSSNKHAGRNSGSMSLSRYKSLRAKNRISAVSTTCCRSSRIRTFTARIP